MYILKNLEEKITISELLNSCFISGFKFTQIRPAEYKAFTSLTVLSIQFACVYLNALSICINHMPSSLDRIPVEGSMPYLFI